MQNFPYEEIRNGEEGDRFDSPQEALDYMIAQHLQNGGTVVDQPTMENIWVANHSDGGDVVLRKNEDGTFEGEEVDSESYGAPVIGGFAVNVSGYFGTKESRMSPEEAYKDDWEIPRDQNDLLEHNFETIEEIEEAYEEQQAASSPGPKF